ncbi:MAG TPA: hypothetical protein VGY96_26285 [Streptosporangiaceae bacterium]|jgi:hypothetical protein|nr:hypothetical protein [Streptosporangiaceae bacterium]
MPETDTEQGSRLDETADMTLPWLTGSPWQTADVLAADAAAYARIQAESMATMVEAFAVAVVIDPDEPIPYVLTEKAERYLAGLSQ